MGCVNGTGSNRISNHLPLVFLETQVANISSEIGKTRYTMRYTLNKDSPKNLYGKIIYQDLIERKVFNTTVLGRLSQADAINYNSMPVQQIVNKQFYNITLVLYEDADYKNIIGRHHDVIWFEMPNKVAELLEIKLL